MATDTCGITPVNDDFYRVFEDKFRGSRELIKSRLRIYLPFIEPLHSFYENDANAVDLGCGRGEWLELLGESGFNAQGVDLDDGMLAICNELGLNSQKRDAIEFLKELPDDSQVIISGFHIAEHMPFSSLQTLIKDAFRTLKPGGLLILETPNSENIIVANSSFYLDPTHKRPIPIELLSFLCSYHGFFRVKKLRMQESLVLSENNAPIKLWNIFNDVSPDYSIVAQKSGNTDILTAINSAFSIEYGITLESLVSRYDQQSEEWRNQITQIEERTTQAITILLNSTSWRITAPLRKLVMILRFLSTPLRSNHLVRNLISNIKAESIKIRQIQGRKKIFIDVSDLIRKDHGTGIQRVVKNIFTNLHEYPPEGYEVEAVWASNDTKGFFKTNLLKTEQSPKEKNNNQIEVYEGDIFLGLDFSCAAIEQENNYLHAMHKHGVNIYFIVYDLLPIKIPECFPDGTNLFHERWLKKISAFDGVFCISATVAQEYKNWRSINVKKIPEKDFKIEYFHLGADIKPINQTMTHNKQLLPDFRIPTFITVGTLEPRKNHLQILEAFETLWSQEIKVNLIIIGKQGWKTKNLIKRLNSHMRLGKQLFWINNANDDLLDVFYSESSCLIAASQDEGFGLPLIEAAQHGLPLLVRDIPIFREICQDNAFYFSGESCIDLANAIRKWLIMSAKNEAPSSNNIKWLSWKECSEQLKALLSP